MRTAGMLRRAYSPWLLLLALVAVGCRLPTVFPNPTRHLSPFKDGFAGPGASPSTRSFLTARGIDDVAALHPRVAFAALEQELPTGSASGPEALLALAELADRIGHGSEIAASRRESLMWSRDAAVYASFCLAEPSSSDEVRQSARLVHNRAVDRCLRRAKTSSGPERSGWPGRLEEAGILLTAGPTDWRTLGFDRIQPADDLVVTRQVARDPRPGLGVPVVVRRKLIGVEKEHWKPYGPREVTFAATATIRPSGSTSPGDWRSRPVELILHDPFREGNISTSGGGFPFSQDLTAPLVDRLTDFSMQSHESLGLISPEYYLKQTGIYPVDPYQPGKIPFLLIQGLWSTPNVWSPMLNTLRADPALRDRYQFWVTLYPTSYIPPLAANAIRRSIREIRDRFDPGHQDAALDRMVVLGKSSGGLFAKMLVQSSGDEIWNSVFARPIDRVRVDEPLRSELASMFFYEPEPSIARVIFVSTGHGGSELARQPGVRLIERWVHAGDPTLRARKSLIADNGIELFQPAYRDHAVTMNDGLNSESPMMRAIGRLPITPRVRYHSIIGNNRRTDDPDRMTDGVLTYRSAHIDGASSEKIIPMRHASEANPEVIEEVRRILNLHLAEPL